MIVEAGDATLAGRAVDLGACDAFCGATPDARTVATAVREGAATTATGIEIAVTARDSGSLHRRVGCITPAVAIRPRTALAAAARSRGLSTPVDEDLADARERLRSHRNGGDDAAAGRDDADVEPLDARTARRRDLAEVTGDVDRLRERAAEERGRLQAGDASDGGGASGSVGATEESSLATAIRDLSEAETAAAAARERHRRAREAARARRDRLQARLRLEDEVGNLAREARAHLVEQVQDVYEAALASMPEQGDEGPDATEGPPTDAFSAAPGAMALAVARVGDLSAPVVLAGDRFAHARTAARWLGAPVVRL